HTDGLEAVVPGAQLIERAFCESVVRVQAQQVRHEFSRGEGQAVGLNAGKVRGGGVVQRAQLLGDAGVAITGRGVDADEVRVVVVHDLVVGGRDEVRGGVIDAGHLLKGNVAAPFVGAVPARHGQPAVDFAAQRQLAARLVGDVAVHIGHKQVLSRVY